MNYAWPMALALAASWLLTGIARALALRLDVVDEPDGDRKLQDHAVPLWGGVAIVIAFALGACTTIGTSQTTNLLAPATLACMVSGAIIFGLGFWDDLLALGGRMKLAVQIVAVLPVAYFGPRCDTIALFGESWELGWLAAPLTMLWLVGCINAMNLLDGMDGSAAVAGIVAGVALGFIAEHHSQPDAARLAAALVGSLAGFLWYNRPPASIYMGDSGSTTMGFALGVLCLRAATLPEGDVRVVVPLVVMTIPLLDTSLAILRRKLTGKRFDQGDRGHLHHRLLDRGLTKWQALGLVGALCLATAVGALAAVWTNSEPLAWLTSMVLVVGLTQLRCFGNYEWSLIKRRLSGATARLSTRLWASTLASLGRRAQSADEAWDELVGELSALPAREVSLTAWHGEQSQQLRVWEGNGETPATTYRWCVTVTAPISDCAYEISVRGHDLVTAEPWYLLRIASLARQFIRRWGAKLDRVGPPSLQVFLPVDEFRDAA